MLIKRWQSRSILALALLVAFVGFAKEEAMAQDDPQKEIDALRKQKEKVDAEKALLEAQRALEQLRNQTLVDLQRSKLLADAQKDAANSQTQAAIASYIGEVKGGSFTGAVDAKEKAGVTEARLLANRALTLAAKKLREQIGDPGAVYVFEESKFPKFQRLASFRFRKETIKQAFASAGIKPPADKTVEFASPALISAGLDAFSKILGFFKTDYTVQGIDVTPSEATVLFAVAGALPNAYVPSIYDPAAHQGAVEHLASELSQLAVLRALADETAATLAKQVEDLEKQIAAATDAQAKASLQKTLPPIQGKIAQLRGVITLYDNFVNALTTPETNGDLPFATLARESALDKAMAGNGKILLVKSDAIGGGYVLKKNLWTGLGTMPMFHMGGASLSFALLEKDGKVLKAGVIPIHGGLVKAGKLERLLNGDDDPD